jgi:ABC-type microcin C transport system permease subunit YejE
MKKYFLYCIATFLLTLAVGAEFIANDDPILYEYEDEWHCGACDEWFSSFEHQTPKEIREILKPLVPFGPGTLSSMGLYLQPPLTEEVKGTHWLGTDSQSRDVLAGLVYGTRYALLIGAISAFFAFGVQATSGHATS